MTNKEFKRFVFLMVIFLIIFIAGIALAFTYEGELDPDEFTKWKFGKVTKISSLTIKTIAQNPDRKAEIQRVQMFLYINGTLLSYRYFKGGEAYKYELNIDKDRYERRRYTDKEHRACRACHRELAPRTSV